METIYADQIVKLNHQHPGILRAADRVQSRGNVEFEAGLCLWSHCRICAWVFLVLGVEKVSKNSFSPCEQIDPRIKPS